MYIHKLPCADNICHLFTIIIEGNEHFNYFLEHKSIWSTNLFNFHPILVHKFMYSIFDRMTEMIEVFFFGIINWKDKFYFRKHLRLQLKVKTLILKVNKTVFSWIKKKRLKQNAFWIKITWLLKCNEHTKKMLEIFQERTLAHLLALRLKIHTLLLLHKIF